jgi:uncharacterized membrane protein YbaN (DUF454 family)
MTNIGENAGYQSDEVLETSVASGRVARYLWTAVGTFFLALGLLGIAVPLLPTTPFLLLAAACYLRGSRKMHRWLLTNRVIGRYLKAYREKRGLPMKVKIVTIFLLWFTIGITALVAIDNIIIQVILFAVAVGVTLHLLAIKTAKEELGAS